MASPVILRAARAIAGVFAGLLLAGLAVAEEPAGFAVNTYQVTGDNPLSAQATAAALEPFKGVKHGLSDLTAAAKGLEQAMRAQGFIFHRVVLPPQTVEHETVQLKVSALTVGNVTVSGNKHFSERNVRRTAPSLAPGATPDIKRLARSLALANDQPDRHLTLNLKESDKPDNIDAELAVQDRRPWAVFANFSNLGSPDLATTRLAVGAQHSNLLGFDDAATVVYTTSPEDTENVKQAVINYRMPTYRLAGVSTFYYAHSDINSGRIQEVFNVSGAGDFYGYAYSQYLNQMGPWRQQLGIGIDDRLFVNNVSFQGRPIGGQVRSRPLTLRYQGGYRGSWLVADVNLSYVRNLGGGDHNDGRNYERARKNSRAAWDAFRYDARLTASLPRAWQAVLMFEGQVAGEAMIAGEQFGVGGVGSVRGFQERGVTGDDGERLGIEIWAPPLPYKLRLLAFFDAGHVERYFSQVGEIDHDVIASAGLGLRWQWRQQLSLAVDYGQDIDDARDPSAGGTKCHVSLTYRY